MPFAICEYLNISFYNFIIQKFVDAFCIDASIINALV